MPYIDPEEMKKLFGAEEMLQLSQLYDPDAAATNDTIIQENIDKAEAFADSYLSNRYADYLKALTVATAPIALQSAVADIARYYLDSIRARDDVRLRYEDAVKWLRLVCDGKVNLPCDQTGSEPTRTFRPGLSGGKRTQYFTDENLSGF